MFALQKLHSLYAVMLAVMMASVTYAEGSLSGSVSLDLRLFTGEPVQPEQERHSYSVAFEPEYYYDWDDGNQRLVVSPFLRGDSSDDERSHADIRELYWRISYEGVDVKVGVAEVFWGVVESQHLVDIINQEDAI